MDQKLGSEDSIVLGRSLQPTKHSLFSQGIILNLLSTLKCLHEYTFRSGDRLQILKCVMSDF